MLTLEEWRDIGLIAIAVGFGALSLIWLLVLLFAGRIGFRIIRALQRAHDHRLQGALEGVERRQRSWREEGLFDPQNAGELLRRTAALRPRRRRKPKRRLWGLLPPAG